jgi:adenine-specific DNA-methyltransferase
MNSVTIDQLRHEANRKLDPSTKGALGQFMTPSRIAAYMAALFTVKSGAALLDAGAGIGSLTLAASGTLTLTRVEAWEVDPVMQGYLAKNLYELNVAHELHAKDFILDSVDRIQFDLGTRFTHAILNPPYKKMGISSVHRLACRQVGLETVNLYSAFVGLAILQMQDKGELVAIIPRSFCNGPYYKPFRDLIFSKCSIDSLHVFESRSEAFKDDDVLQENVIIKLTRGKPQGTVTISFSRDADFDDLTQRDVDFCEIVRSGDAERFIRIPPPRLASADSATLSHTLEQLGLGVSTGPVVDFRLKAWWSAWPSSETVPLIYPHHFTADGFQHPKEHKKPNALCRSVEVDKWLMPAGSYVLVKRFSAKEERRRVVAYLVTADQIGADWVGFENHWNVFHVRKQGLSLQLAKGLVCFLNSTMVDEHFRVFSGHTQVNATDLRSLRYPSEERLLRLGAQHLPGMQQDDIDRLVAVA